MSPENSLVKEFLEVDEHHLKSDLRHTMKSYTHLETMDRMMRIIEHANARFVTIRRDRLRRTSTISRNGMAMRTNSHAGSNGDRVCSSVSRTSPSSSTNRPLSSSPVYSKSSSSSFSGKLGKEIKEGRASFNSLNGDQDFASSSSSMVPSSSVKSRLMTGLHETSELSQKHSQSYDESSFHLQLLALENLVHNMYTLQIKESSYVPSSTYFFEKEGLSIYDILSEPVKQGTLINVADDVMKRISSRELKDIGMHNLSPDAMVVKSFKSQPETVSGVVRVNINSDEDVSTTRSTRYTPKYGRRAYINDNNSRIASGNEDLNNRLSNGSSGGGVSRSTRSASMNIMFSQR